MTVNWNGASVLVTGAGGFLGYNLALEFVRRGARVTAHTYTKEKDLESRQVRLQSFRDLRVPGNCIDLAKNHDVVVHCAAATSGAEDMVNRPMGHVTPNLYMNAALLEAAYVAGVKLFVFMSSGAAYPDEGGGILDVQWTEDDLFAGDPSDVYYAVGWMKRYTEILCRTYAERIPGRKMGVVVIRPSNVYGPTDKFDPKKSHVMASLIRRVAAREDPFVVWGTGEDRRDFVYIDDFVEGVFRAFDYHGLAQKFDVFNIASGEVRSVAQVLEQLFQVAGWRPRVLQFDTSKPSTVPVRKISAAKAQSLLHWSAKTSLEVGLKAALDWYKKEYPDV